MLEPIYRLLFRGDRVYSPMKYYLALTQDQIEVSYKTYKSGDMADMQEIFGQKLAPGRKVFQTKCDRISVASVKFGQDEHAMVLDTYDKDRDVLIFKNTHNDPVNGQPKKFEIERTDQNAPTELYFVHIKILDMENLPSQTERDSGKKEEKNIRQKSHTLAQNRKRTALSRSTSKNGKTAKS